MSGTKQRTTHGRQAFGCGLFRALTSIALASGMLLGSPYSLEAHPFAFDQSKMTGFNVLTAEDGAMKAEDMVVIEYEGPIESPMVENLRAIWGQIRKNSRFQTVVLRLNSPGGADLVGEGVIEILAEIRERVSFNTVVAENDLCASMCIALFVQGEKRFASPASSWMFHGASARLSNIPSLSMTARYFDLFKERDIDQRFIDFLFDNDYVTTPGAYWISGGELVRESNIITNLLPNWRPAEPVLAAQSTIRGGI